MIKFVRVKTGWHDDKMEQKLNKIIERFSPEGWTYHDIKISSASDNTLLVLKSK